MGGIAEVIASYAIFLGCLTTGLAVLYQNLAQQGSLYEIRENSSDSLTIEQQARQDAAAYAAFLQRAQRYDGSTSGTTTSTCPSLSRTVDPATFNAARADNLPPVPNGYSITLQQGSATSTVATAPDGSQTLQISLGLTAASGSLAASVPVLAQLRRGGSTGPILAEYPLRC